MASTVQPRSTIQSVERAAAILGLLAGPQRRLGVAELARELALPKGTIHGILRTLQLHGFVEQDPDSNKYRLGCALVPMGVGYLAANRLRAAALDPTHALAVRTGESVRVAILRRRHALIIHHLTRAGDARRTLETGRPVPLHATALGKALLTHQPSLPAELTVSPLVEFTPATVTDPARLRRQIATASRRGWASEQGEFSVGAAGIAAPVAGRHGSDVAAIGLDGPLERLSHAGAPRTDLVDALLAAARATAQALAAASRSPPKMRR